MKEREEKQNLQSLNDTLKRENKEFAERCLLLT
jgi:hypothetical protein